MKIILFITALLLTYLTANGLGELMKEQKLDQDNSGSVIYVIILAILTIMAWVSVL